MGHIFVEVKSAVTYHFEFFITKEKRGKNTSTFSVLPTPIDFNFA
jgi:hypothetical protein